MPGANPLGRQRGFTLAETVVTLGIFVMVVVAISNIYLLYTRAQKQTLTREKMVAEASILLDEIARQVRTREIVFRGLFDYDGDGMQTIAGTYLYSLDADGGPNPASFISGGEIELALKDTSNGLLVYLFNAGGTDLCVSPGLASDNPSGLYVFSGLFSSGTVVNCSRLLDLPNVTVEDARFYISPSINPYPAGDADCKLGTLAATTFNGYFCQASVAANCPSALPFVDGRCEVPNQQPRVTIVLKLRDNRFPTSSITLQTTVSSRIYRR